ncbi:MAG TPA: hypothetical protein VK171_07070, partial [Fimbriimonas sp.]|nr:hypothetical protein [Fimbriimonas sp.]
TVAPGAGGVGAVARQGGKLVKAGSKASKFLDVANKTIHPVKGGISLVKKLELPTLNAVKKMGEVAHEGIEAGKNMRHGVVRSVKNTLRPTPSVSQKVLKAKGVIHPKQMDALIREKEELAKELALARKNFDEVIGEKKEYIYPAKERLLAARKKALINQKAIEKVGKQHLWPDVPKDHFTFDHLKVDKANAAEVAAESRRLKGRNLTRAEEEGVKTSSPIVDTSERLDKAFDKINDASDPKVLEQRTAYNNKAAKNLPKGKKAAEKTVDKALSAKDVPRQVSNHNATMANTALSKFTKSVSGPYLGEAVGVIEDVLSPVARFSPALRETTEAYISPRGTIKGIKKLFKKSTYKDAIEKGKTGFNELDREAQRLGIPTDVNVKYPKWLAKTSNWQGALRTPIQHAAFKKEMVKQIELAKRLGKELDYKEAFTAAYRASQRAIMRNDNQLMKRTVETLEDGKRVMKEIPKEKRVFRGLSDLADQRPAADLILPLPRGASNYVGRMAEYAVGVPHAVYKHIKSARRAGKMTAEEAGEIVRAYKRGLVGNATGVAGYYGASDIDDQGNVTIGGVKIPEKVMRTPVAELFRTGAQIKKTGLTRKTAEKVLGNVISNAPGSEILAPVSRALSRSQPGNPAADIGEAVGGGLVPPKVAAEAREIVEEMLSQQKPNPRKSKGAAIKAGAPVSPAVVAEAKRIIDEMVRIQKAKSKKHNRR